MMDRLMSLSQRSTGRRLLLRNNGTKNHWLGLSLVGSKSNRNGIGARVTVTDSAGKKQIFDANTSGSYLASNDPRIVVGLGSASVRKVEVSGRAESFRLLRAAVRSVLDLNENRRALNWVVVRMEVSVGVQSQSPKSNIRLADSDFGPWTSRTLVI